jgi:N4-gp56 family major capsid protein
MAITTTSTLPSPVQQSFSYKLLSVPVPNMIHKIPAMKKNMPRNGGNTLRMRRYNPLSTAMVPLGNSGVTPPAQNLTAVDRLYVHVKFSLIDLETVVAIG